MLSNKASFHKGRFFLFIIAAIFLIILYLLEIPWETHVKFVLNDYKRISGCFFIIVFLVIVSRIVTLWQKGIAPETRRYRLGFGPIFDLFVDPFIDGSLFYSALFMLYTIFQEGLSFDPFLILLAVAGSLLYQSVNDVIKMARKVFYIQRTEKPQTV